MVALPSLLYKENWGSNPPPLLLVLIELSNKYCSFPTVWLPRKLEEEKVIIFYLNISVMMSYTCDLWDCDADFRLV